MPNALTRHVGLNAGTWVLETLFKHYADNLFKERGRTDNQAKASGVLRRDELLYDEVFHIVKSFMDASTQHTVEELQEFSNARTPSPPWIHVMRLLIPMSCCEAAAAYLIEALGGEQKAREVAGGTKWWQVRGLRGVDAQWIVARKDFNKSVRKRARNEMAETSENPTNIDDSEDGVKMDELGCILYFHGGGYYFGSVDQERYFLQRFARKASCRLLAINYRLAPQYPFPCAIHDAVASYLYLIRPPPGSPHRAIDPSRIIVSGDSAGGGLTLALLQVLRDSSLPLPAGGVAISPWCDLTHSFPSIHINTDTDIIPKYGLSVYKPSPLWPAPSEDLTYRVHHGLRSRVERMVRQYSDGHQEVTAPTKSSGSWKLPFLKPRRRSKSEIPWSVKKRDIRSHSLADDARTGDVRAAAVNRSQSRLSNGVVEQIDVGSAAPLPTADRTSEQTLQVVSKEGETLTVHDQVHMYAPNNLLVHPLVSPAYSYLGGLPPLLIIASDAEVLRDEIIYSAHKAAHPDRYPVKPEARQLYPKLEGIENRYGPTKVHLQVYDQTAHVLPVLFSFCTPAKFCFRAMNSFTRYVNGTLPRSIDESRDRRRPTTRRSLSVSLPRRLSMMKSSKSRASQNQRETSLDQPEVDEFGHRASESSSRSSSIPKVDTPRPEWTTEPEQIRFAGNPAVYLECDSPSPFVDNMIRERVSITGEIRPLEPETELPACTMPDEHIGTVNELALRRYQEGRAKWDERFGRTMKRIQKHRLRNLARAQDEGVRNVAQLQMYFFQNAEDEERSGGAGAGVSIKEGLRKTTASWAWAWALDGAERPPPSSIVARRDTEEARRLSRIADLPVDQDDKHVSANNLWTYLVNRLNTEKKEAEGERRSTDERVDVERVERQAPAPAPASEEKKERGTEEGVKEPKEVRGRVYFSLASRPRTATDTVRGRIKRFWSESTATARDSDAGSETHEKGTGLPRTKSR